MIRRSVIPLILACFASTAMAQSETSELVPLDTQRTTRGWEAVGRLDTGRGGFCTATLIRARVILTAAHCVYNDNGDLIPIDDFLFRAGLRNGRADATRSIVRIVPHPDYLHNGPTIERSATANDIAILELSQAIRYAGVDPFPIAARPFPGDDVSIVSYGQNRSEAPSLQELCQILHRHKGSVIMNCDVEPGSSGSPVFKISNGRARIVSVVSALSTLNDEPISIGTSLQEPLQILLAEFAALGPAKPGGIQRFQRVGDSHDTGANFVTMGD